MCSQTNPHIVPALNIKRHVPRTIADLVESEFKHRSVRYTPVVAKRAYLGVKVCTVQFLAYTSNGGGC